MQSILKFLGKLSDEELYNKLIVAIKSEKSLEALELIPKMKNEELAKPNDYGNTFLLLALNKNLRAVCEALVLRMSDEDINVIETYVQNPVEQIGQKEQKETYFTLAAAKGYKGVCENLAPRMSKETSNVITANKHTALTLAASKGKGWEEICEKLILKMDKEVINNITKTNSTALTLAADKNLPQVCIKLIPIMFDEVINVTENRYNDSALRKAIWNDLDVVCQMLIPLTSKENINYIDGNDRTLLTLAAQKGMKVVCEKLISRMIEDGSLDIINHVISKGELKGESALSLARKHKGFENICELLKAKQIEYQEQKQKENKEKCEESQSKKIVEVKI